MSNYESLLLLVEEYKNGYTRLEEDEFFAKMTVFLQSETLSYEEYQYVLQLLSEVNTNEK